MAKTGWGGKRKKCGRKKGEPSTTIRVPVTLANVIKSAKFMGIPASELRLSAMGCKESDAEVIKSVA